MLERGRLARCKASFAGDDNAKPLVRASHAIAVLLNLRLLTSKTTPFRFSKPLNDPEPCGYAVSRPRTDGRSPGRSRRCCMGDWRDKSACRLCLALIPGREKQRNPSDRRNTLVAASRRSKPWAPRPHDAKPQVAASYPWYEPGFAARVRDVRGCWR